jgi:hypothetical protein
MQSRALVRRYLVGHVLASGDSSFINHLLQVSYQHAGKNGAGCRNPAIMRLAADLHGKKRQFSRIYLKGFSCPLCNVISWLCRVCDSRKNLSHKPENKLFIFIFHCVTNFLRGWHTLCSDWLAWPTNHPAPDKKSDV